MNKLRDELAEKSIQTEFQNWKASVTKTNNPCIAPRSDVETFKAGWDAAIKELCVPNIEMVKKQNRIEQLESELARVEKNSKVMSDKLNSYFVAGSDGCTACESGRVTYYKRTMLCYECTTKNESIGAKQ